MPAPRHQWLPSFSALAFALAALLCAADPEDAQAYCACLCCHQWFFCFAYMYIVPRQPQGCWHQSGRTFICESFQLPYTSPMLTAETRKTWRPTSRGQHYGLTSHDCGHRSTHDAQQKPSSSRPTLDCSWIWCRTSATYRCKGACSSVRVDHCDRTPATHCVDPTTSIGPHSTRESSSRGAHHCGQE